MSTTLSRILLVSLPFQFALPIGSSWDLPLARLLSGAIIAVFLIEQLAQRTFRMRLPQAAIILAFLLWVTSSLLWAAQGEMAFPKALFLINILPLLIVWQEELHRPGHADVYIRSLLWGAAGAASVAIGVFLAQFIFGVSQTFHMLLDEILPFFLGQELAQMVVQYPSLLVNIGGETWLRATAFFPDPHVASFFFGMTGFLALGYSRQQSDRHYFFLALLLFFADILSFSRGGYIGLLVGSVGYIIFSRGTAWPTLSHSLGRWSFALAALFAVFGPAIVSRFISSFTLGDASSVARISLWTDAMETFLEYPVFGTGIGNYLSIAQPLASSSTPFYAHNLYLDVAIETGIVGILLLGALFTVIIYQLLLLRGKNKLAAGLFGAILLYLSHSLFETALFSTHVSIIIMFLLALSSIASPSNLLQSKHDSVR